MAARLATEQFTLAVSSDLKRAFVTGEAIVAANQSLTELEAWPIMRERNFGECEGQSADKLTKALKEREKGPLIAWGPPGGETGLVFRDRVKQFISSLGPRVVGLQEDSVVVLATCHGGFIKEFNT